MDFLREVLKNNQIDKKKMLEMSPLVFAYLGDTIYDIFIRTYLVGTGIAKVSQLHKASINYVKAKAQADAVKNLSEFLTEEEHEIIRRGRNIKPASPPKNADIMDYRYATGFEALIGYLYASGEHERMKEILDKVISPQSIFPPEGETNGIS